MANAKLNESTIKYANEFKYWKDTANQFFTIAQEQIDEALKTSSDDLVAVELIAEAWHKCMTAQWTLFKSGKQTANRMALRRGVDNRVFHPAQAKKKRSTAEDDVNRALSGK